MALDHPLVTALTPVLDALGARVVAADVAEPADIPVVWEGETVAAVRLPPLHGALDRLIEAVEGELGGPLPTLSREDKHRAVEDLADAMQVSRITVYNYLNAIHR
jgi:hypothetical protein